MSKPPTAECMIKVMVDRLNEELPIGYYVYEARLFETAKCFARYTCNSALQA